MANRQTLSLPPSLHRAVTLAQNRAFELTGKKPTLGALLESAWAAASAAPCTQHGNQLTSKELAALVSAIAGAISALGVVQEIIAKTNQTGPDRTIVEAADGIDRASGLVRDSSESASRISNGSVNNTKGRRAQ